MAVSAELLELAAKVSNWGRWGDDDQRGTANLLTDESALRGASAVRSGQHLSLALDYRAEGVQVGQPAGRKNVVLGFSALNERDAMAPGVWTGTDDVVTFSTCAATHIDGLSHIAYDGLLYGGRSVDTITAETGATWCGAENLPDVVTRGILLDIPAALGHDLEPGAAVGADELDAALALTGCQIESGDVVCVRTGDMRWYHRGERQRYATGVDWQLPGLAMSAVEWFWSRDVAGAFTDTYAYEVFPPETGNWDDLLAVHMIQLRDMGMLQGQNWNLEKLSAACHDDSRYDFMLVADPQRIVGATSAPVNPVAIR